MYNKLRIKLKVKVILEYLVLFLMIIECNSMWIYIIGNPNQNHLVLSAIVFFLSIAYMLFYYNNSVGDIFIACCCSFIYLLILYILRPTNITLFYRIYLLFVSAFIITKCNKKYITNLLFKLSNIIFVIASGSIIMWFFCIILKSFSPTAVYSNWSHSYTNSFWNIYFTSNQYAFLNISGLSRSFSIFAEAPMASYVFSIGFLIELLIKKNTTNYKLVVLALANFITFSSTGIILIVSSIAMYLFNSKNDNLYLKLLKYILFPLLLIVSIFITSNLYKAKISSDSGVVRLDDFRAGYKAWKNNLFFGNGIGNITIIQSKMSYFRLGNKGYSNSLMSILSDGGLYLLIPYLYAIIIGVKNFLKTKDFRLFIFEIEFIYIFIITITHYTMLSFYVFLSFLYIKNQSKSVLLTNK